MLTSVRANQHPEPSVDLSAERALYQQALKHLRQGQIGSFKRKAQQLEDYALYPYLLHSDLQRRLYTRPNEAVQKFIAQYPDLPITRRLHRKWLSTLGKHRDWENFEKFYTSDVTTDTLDCYLFRSHLARGDQQTAWQGAEKLWLTGRSRPDVCDPLFKAWHASGALAPELVWKRIHLAYSQRNGLLGKYLIRFLPDQQQALGELYRSVYRQPGRLKKTENFTRTDARTADILYTGLQRLSYREPLEALKLWNHYQKNHQFSDVQKKELNGRISLYLLKQFKHEKLNWVEKVASSEYSPKLVEWRVRMALREQDWNSVLHWLDFLSEDLQNEPRWMYWTIRAEEALGLQTEQSSFSQRYQKLADSRNFYGFLSANHIGSPYSITNIPSQTNSEMLSSIAALPAIQRAYEFYQLNDLTSARREWRHLTSTLTTQQKMATAQLAHDWSWYNQSIRSTISARSWDDLNLRFPLAFKDKIQRHSKQQNIDTSWVFAVARQESAFMHDARSSAGALGLLQLMPSTAKQVARKSKARYKGKHELLNPDTNIKLGSTYLAQLLDRFDGNRVLATAAYNAGPHRVNQWLKGSAQIPYDIWIETIPYQETRQYVQNVLSYNLIYSEKLGITPRFLTADEVNGSYGLN